MDEEKIASLEPENHRLVRECKRLHKVCIVLLWRLLPLQQTQYQEWPPLSSYSVYRWVATTVNGLCGLVPVVVVLLLLCCCCCCCGLVPGPPSSFSLLVVQQVGEGRGA